MTLVPALIERQTGGNSPASSGWMVSLRGTDPVQAGLSHYRPGISRAECRVGQLRRLHRWFAPLPQVQRMILVPFAVPAP
jgi:hypothetical protein